MRRKSYVVPRKVEGTKKPGSPQKQLQWGQRALPQHWGPKEHVFYGRKAWGRAQSSEPLYTEHCGERGPVGQRESFVIYHKLEASAEAAGPLALETPKAERLGPSQLETLMKSEF